MKYEAVGVDFRPALIYTTHRQFPRHGSAAMGRLVAALAALIQRQPDLPVAYYLQPVED